MHNSRFLKGTITSFTIVRYNTDITHYILFESHISCFVENKVCYTSYPSISMTLDHYSKIATEIFEKDLHQIAVPNERWVQKKLKINNYLKNLISFTSNPITGSHKQINDAIYEIDGAVKIFELLSRSIGMTVNYNQGSKKEIYAKYHRGDIYILILVLLYFVLLTAGDKKITCNLYNYDFNHYFTVDYSNMLSDETVMKLITSSDCIDDISNTCEFEYFFLLKFIRKMLKNYSSELSFSLPGNSLSNLRISVKIIEDCNPDDHYHESNWIDQQWERIQSYMNENSSSSKTKDNIFERIYAVVKLIPMGKVTTYGKIAALAGNPRWARVVGYALHVNPDPANIPCHRVVNKEGCLSSAFAFGGKNRQHELLEAEGVTFDKDGRVDLFKHNWDGIF